MRFDDLIGLWLDGQRRLADADPAERPAMERVRDQIVYELRRRGGGIGVAAMCAGGGMGSATVIEV